MSGYSIAVTGNVPVNVPINFVTNSGTAVSASNNINIFGSGGSSTSGSGNTVTITTTSGIMTWTDQASDFDADVNNGYFCTDTLIVTLPSGATQGQTVVIETDTVNPVTVQANAGQFLRFGAQLSSIAGTAVSTDSGDSIYLVYREVSSTWHSISTEGTWGIS